MGFPVELTTEAVAAAKRYIARKGPEGAFLRIGVKGGGCSGLEYVMRPETKELPIDLVTEVDGLKIVCDKKSAAYLEGSVLRWTGNLMGGAFDFDNPNAARGCGCGTSFTPKPRA